MIDLERPTHDVVILGGGEYPQQGMALQILQQAKRVVCCDGAAYELLRHNLEPWKIVGDCDSIFSPSNDQEKQWLAKYRDIICRISEQDDNDQTKAVRYCLEQGLRDIAIVGATGRREDHTLGNISLLIEYMRMGANVRLYTDYGVFIACHNRTEIQVSIPRDFEAVSDAIATRQKSTQVSIFNVSAHGFSATGLRYPLYDFTQWWQGTLNEAIDSPVVIDAEGDYIVFINLIPS